MSYTDNEIIDMEELNRIYQRDLPRRIWCVSLYQMRREMGGREEGGWWYDTGNLERIVYVRKTGEEAYRLANRMNHLLAFFARKARRRDRFSMAYQGDEVQAMVHKNFPESFFPAVRPHYE